MKSNIISVGKRIRSSINRRSPVILRHIIFGLLVAASVIAAGCVLEQEWKPSGTVEIVQFREWDNGFGTTCTITYRITNNGGADIYSSTITIRVVTDTPDGEEQMYYSTIEVDTRIPAGESVTGTYDVEYYLPEEVAQEEGVSLDDFFLQ